MTALSDDIVPVKCSPDNGVQYHEFTCCKCGERARNTYSEPHRTNMLTRRLCWTCNYWVDQDTELSRKHRERTIIDGRIYGPGNRTSGQFRGMAGRRFDIEYLPPSIYAGQRITTFDLWAGSTLPDELRAKYPDTARFLGGAAEAKSGEITCFNPSDPRAPAYPLPASLRPNKDEPKV